MSTLPLVNTPGNQAISSVGGASSIPLKMDDMISSASDAKDLNIIQDFLKKGGEHFGHDTSKWFQDAVDTFHDKSVSSSSNSASSYKSNEEALYELAKKDPDYLDAYINYMLEREFLDRQMEFEARMSNTAYTRAFQDIKNAGYNPWLMLQSGAGAGASTPSVSAGSISANTLGSKVSRENNKRTTETSRENNIRSNKVKMLGNILNMITRIVSMGFIAS